VAGRTVAVNLSRDGGSKIDPSGRPWETSSCSMLKTTVRMGRIVVGLLLLLIGAILSLPLVPGPGLLLVVVGLSVLSHDFHWARRLRDWAHREWDHVRRRHVG
jgi:uncharacterized protein (TIGR02611 family)